jgi:hypothetical protein
VLSEDLAKFDAQCQVAAVKIIDVLRTAFKGDEARVDNACRIADRVYPSRVAKKRTSRVVYHEFSMYHADKVALLTKGIQ